MAEPAFFLENVLDYALSVVIYHVNELDTVFERIFLVLDRCGLKYLADKLILCHKTVYEQ